MTILIFTLLLVVIIISILTINIYNKGKTLKTHGAMLEALNKTAIMFLSQSEETFVKMMSSGMGQIVGLFGFDRFSLFRNFAVLESSSNTQIKNQVLYTSQIYRWDKIHGGTTPVNNNYVNVSYDELIPNWKNSLKEGRVINGPRKSMPKQEEVALKAAGTLSVLVVPVFIDDAFWGIGYFEDLYNEKYFDDDCIEIMRSAAFLCANAVMRNEMENERGKLMTDIYYRDEILNAVNHAAALLLNSDVKTFDNDLYQSMGIMAKAVRTDRMYIWKNHIYGGQLSHTQLYEWSNSAESQLGTDSTINLAYNSISPGWEEFLSNGNCVNGLVRNLSPEAQAYFSKQDILSVLIAPIFINEKFWGIIGFNDCHNERLFTEEEVSILQSGGLLFANALLRNDMFRNISDTSARLEKALEQANAASKAKGDFLSTMSHEMRTPMNAIIGMTTIGKKAEDIEAKNHALSKIGDASSHLLGVINDVLDMAKIEANKLELSSIEFNFGRMLQRVITVINFRVDEKRQKFSVDTDSNIPNFLIGDDQRLAQVITNLLSNAVKFTGEGGEIKLNASLISETDRECELRIDVSDSGIGIDSSQHDKMFGMFEQAESGTSRQYGGTGLGLGIVKNIVELMGGKIWVESEIGEGAQFSFTVKMKRGTKNPRSLLSHRVNCDNVLDCANECLGSPRINGDIEHTEGEFAEKNLLLAEDIEINREIFISLLEDTGINIDCAENGVEALEMVEAAPKKYDIIFMDIQMPKMDGLEATRRIRVLPDVKMPIIAITANVFKDDIEECIEAGMNDHLGKPLDIDRLLEVMRKYLIHN